MKYESEKDSSDIGSQYWNKGVKGEQVLPIINSNQKLIRVEAGPGTGKTFGLVRRVQRILHPEGLNVPGRQVLIVAFNRVIAKQLQSDVDECLSASPHDGGEPVIRTVHALCLEVIGEDLRLLLPHEREAMIYDVRQAFPEFKKKYDDFRKMEQALRDHEAKHIEDMKLWQAVQQWLVRHKAQLISDLPSLLLAKLQGGDCVEKTYRHIIVDEFQDLTSGEQKLFLRLRSSGGYFMALGDPRQSIYAFRGNDRDGLYKIEDNLTSTDDKVTDITMTQCQRCPKQVVEAANQLMGLSKAKPMIPGSEVVANTRIVHWKSIEAEASGMAKAIVDNIHANRDDNHLVMVTRRQFGYLLREKITAMDPSLVIDLSFSESLLETWAVREAFMFFCLITDPDAPTWRAWLGYQNSLDGKNYKAPERNADSYLKLLRACNDTIEESHVYQLTKVEIKPPGKGGSNLRQRALRFAMLKEEITWDRTTALSLLREVFDVNKWGVESSSDPLTAGLDMDWMFGKASKILEQQQTSKPNATIEDHLQAVGQQLRYHIATREPFEPEDACDLKVSTLWGAKGVTADHVYVIGACRETLPGNRREEYPGTELEYVEEQRRLFYVTLTRSKKTLVFSRAKSVPRGKASQLGLAVTSGTKYLADLKMSPFLQDILQFLPQAEDGETWTGVAGR